MAISITYKCDCCGHEQSDPTQMWNVHIGYSSANRLTQYPSQVKAQLWCRKCMEKQDLLCGDSNPKAQMPPVAPPTLEEIIREMMREEIASITGAC